jgi:hypothetical protein
MNRVIKPDEESIKGAVSLNEEFLIPFFLKIGASSQIEGNPFQKPGGPFDWASPWI